MITERRSVRNYTDEKVSRELLSEIVELCRYAPSWANTQVARYTIVDDKDKIMQIHQKGVNGFSYNMGTLEKAQGVVVLSYVLGKSGKYGEDYATNKSSQWEMFDAGIACQTFSLAAHAKGLGTCIFGIIDDAAIAEIVDLPEGETVACIITYGFEKGEHPSAPKRKELEQIMRFVGEK